MHHMDTPMMGGAIGTIYLILAIILAALHGFTIYRKYSLKGFIDWEKVSHACEHLLMAWVMTVLIGGQIVFGQYALILMSLILIWPMWKKFRAYK